MITATLVEGGSDQFDLVAFDFVVKVDAAFVEVDLFVVIDRELSVQRFDLISESFGEHDDLINALVNVGFVSVVRGGCVLQDLHGEDLTPKFQRDSVR